MSSSGTVYDQYFEWLYSQVASVRNRNPARSYWKLLRQFYTTRFYWSIRNDDNRAADGVDLRYEFLLEKDIGDPDPYWLELDCSVLEMLVALSRRVSFESSGTPSAWFWKLVQNLELSRYTDDIHEISIGEEVDEVLDRLLSRKYERNGVGGLFPLRTDHGDQTRVEIWYQMSNYLLEGDRVANGPQ